MVEWLATSAIAVAGFAISTYHAYTRNDKELSNRVSIVENQQTNDGARLERIENKVDKVLDHLLEKK